MIQVPDWAFEAASQETRSMTQNIEPFNPARYLNAAQVILVLAYTSKCLEHKLKFL